MRQSNHHENLSAVIVCVADSCQYLVGAEDKDGNFYNIFSNKKNEPKHCSSFEQSKNLLRDKGYTEVWLDMQTPYDEMIGLSSANHERSLHKL